MVTSKAACCSWTKLVNTNWYDPGLISAGSNAVTDVDVCVVTVSVTVSKVTPGVLFPKYLPLIVMVGGLTARSATAAVMTGCVAAQAGVTPKILTYMVPSTARQVNAPILRRWSNIILPLFVSKVDICVQGP
jgi:hypothetical protein